MDRDLASLGVVCPAPGGFSFLPDPLNCSRFYDCQLNNESKQRGCAEGTLFDPITHQCNHRHLVKCKEDTGSSTFHYSVLLIIL